jgi:dTDP-4-amino-4,6-dideoxygalactose transaminase
MDAYRVVKDFERAVAEYTGAPYVVAVNSCTMALLLAFAWDKKWGQYKIEMPSRTYPSVPMSARHAGLEVVFKDYDWQAKEPRHYQMEPSFIIDSAKRFTSNMFRQNHVHCVSFHAAKLLKIGQGGAILHDDKDADAWYRRMRFDGRTEGMPTADDSYDEPGYHCYMSPDSAARGLWLMQSYPKDMPDQEAHHYPDMSRWAWK